MMSRPSPTPPPRTYLSGGQVLQTPPFTARIRNFVDSTYNFLGLYVTTLFSARFRSPLLFDPFLSSATFYYDLEHHINTKAMAR
ncbi:hypothetical protein XANCAGTX0491_003790 [Xanthoria calcicola]